jgi:hypothetical protein
MLVPNPAFDRNNSLKHAAVESPIDEKHQAISEGAMEAVKELRLDPVSNHNPWQSDRARPHSRRGMKADRAGDEDERGDPSEGQDQSPENDFHASPRFGSVLIRRRFAGEPAAPCQNNRNQPQDDQGRLVEPRTQYHHNVAGKSYAFHGSCHVAPDVAAERRSLTGL